MSETANRAIVVGVDDSEEALDALALAAALSAGLDRRLVVASAVEYDPTATSESNYNEAKGKYLEEVFSRTEERLGDAPYERRVLQDTAAHGLHRLAEDEHPELLVVGSTHRGGLGRVFPGSVAERLLHGSPCPVAVAPRKLAISEDRPFELIGVAVDGSSEARDALDYAIGLARGLAAGLRLITVGPQLRWGAFGYAPPEVLHDEVRRVLQEAKGAVPSGVNAEAVYKDGDPVVEIAEQGRELDLLVLGSRAYGPLRSVLLGSVSNEVMRAAFCPVLVVPRGAHQTPTGEPTPAQGTRA